MAEVDIDGIESLAFEVFEIMKKQKEKSHIIKNSIPILYFGNLDLYENSNKKIITVGLNPSNKEFSDNDKKYSVNFRFPCSKLSILDHKDFLVYKKDLDNYFDYNPYSQWFNSLCPILSGFQAGFGGTLKKCQSYENTAIHTDIATPFATDPTFSGLEDNEKCYLLNEGFEIWKKLISYLKPDIIILSGNKRIKEKLMESFCLSGSNFEKIQNLKDLEVWTAAIKIDPSKDALLIYGQTANFPFGKISDENKKKIGSEILKKI